MKSIRFRLLLAAIAVLLGTAISRAQDADAAPAPPPNHPHAYGMRGPEMGFFAHALNLTDDQKAQMKSIWQKEQPTMKPLFQQSRQIEQQMHQYAEGTYDEAKVRTLATQKAQVEAEIAVQRTQIHNQMYQLLTADQKAQLKELEAQHAARRTAHMLPDAPPAPPTEE
jgi:Spy/CpxP family protein refolding chaperone